MLCRNPAAHPLLFEPVNSIFNVMSAGISSKHQIICKMVKQLDFQMIRRPEELEIMQSVDEDPLFIPVPTFECGIN